MSCIVQWSDLYCITRCNCVWCNWMHCPEEELLPTAANDLFCLPTPTNQEDGDDGKLQIQTYFTNLSFSLHWIIAFQTFCQYLRTFLGLFYPTHHIFVLCVDSRLRFLRDFLIHILPRCVQWFDHVQCTLCIFCSNLERGTFWKLIWLLLAPISKIAFYVFLAYLFSTVSLV